MASEPILWVRPNYQPPQITRPGPDGEPIVEKLPATALPPEDHPLHGQAVRRWELMVDEAGNEVRAVYSGAAADYQVDHPNYGAAIKTRHRRRGWFPMAACPLVLVRGGLLDPGYVRSMQPGDEPCEPGTYSAKRPCPHALAEAKFRKERNTRREAKRAEAFRSETEKMAREAQKNQEKQNDTLAELVRQQGELIKALIGGGGQWPLMRPNMTAEEFEAADKARMAENAALIADQVSAQTAEPTSDAELEAMLMGADADEPPPVAPTPKGRKGR